MSLTDNTFISSVYRTHVADKGFDLETLIEEVGYSSVSFNDIYLEDFEENEHFSSIDSERLERAETVLKFQQYCEKAINENESYQDEINRHLQNILEEFGESRDLGFLYDENYLRDVKLRYEELDISMKVLEVERETGSGLSEGEGIEEKAENFIMYLTGEKYSEED